MPILIQRNTKKNYRHITEAKNGNKISGSFNFPYESKQAAIKGMLHDAKEYGSTSFQYNDETKFTTERFQMDWKEVNGKMKWVKSKIGRSGMKME